MPAYSSCPFTQKVLKLCRMLHERGHDVIHYGHADSVVACGEHVAVTTDADLAASYPGHDWRTQGPPRYRAGDAVYATFTRNAAAAVAQRKRRGDFLLCPFGNAHKAVADAHPDLIVCEPGIGYPDGGFAPFRVFESYAVMHAYGGMAAVRTMSDRRWYDVVIPHCFDPADFTPSAAKDDFFLFLGRITPAKGVHIALQVVEEVGGRLVVAGPGSLRGRLTRTDRPVADYVRYAGVVGVERRRDLLARAKCLLAPSLYFEPFCCAHVEAMMSGTPVIATDWGAFAETVIHGVTGYRCRTFEQFTWAARNLDRLSPQACRDWAAANFSPERVGAMYEEYFQSLTVLRDGGGWYAANPGRTELDWLKRVPPRPSQPAGPADADEGDANERTVRARDDDRENGLAGPPA